MKNKRRRRRRRRNANINDNTSKRKGQKWEKKIHTSDDCRFYIKHFFFSFTITIYSSLINHKTQKKKPQPNYHLKNDL